MEDDVAVRRMALRVLERAGYVVEALADGREALERARSGEASFDLLLSDVVMPQLSGPALAQELARTQPGLRVLYSGYLDDALARVGLVVSEVDLLPKPYAPSSLLRRVREVLDR